MTGEIVNQNQISVTVQLQAEVEVFVKGQIKLISNPCIVREETQKKNYPVILYTVKQNDNLWDIAKKYRVPVERIMEINKTETIREGMKIVVAK
jgi:LysM repeat protein